MKKLFILLILLTIIGCNKENDTALGWDDVFLENYSCDVYFSDQSFYDPKINNTVKTYNLRFSFYYSIEDLQDARLFYLNHRLNFTLDDKNQNLIVEFDSLTLDFINAATSHEHLFLFIHKKKRLEFRFKKNEKIEFSINQPIYTYKRPENQIDRLFYDVANGNQQFTTNITDVLANNNSFIESTARILPFSLNDSLYKELFEPVTLYGSGYIEMTQSDSPVDSLGIVIGFFDFPWKLNPFIQTEDYEGDIITIYQERPTFRLPYFFYKF